MRTFTVHSQQLSCFPGSLAVKNPPAMPETWVRSLGREDPLEKEMATHFSILAWEMPWTEEPGGLQSMGSRRVRHGWGNWARATDEIAPDGFTEATAVRETWGLGEGKTESLHSKPLKNFFLILWINDLWKKKVSSSWVMYHSLLKETHYKILLFWVLT